MKVLSLLQPWATLVVIGAKKIETRSWDTKYRGPLLIHASKKLARPQRDLCVTDVFAEALKDIDGLPLGQIIGKVNILGTVESETIVQCMESKIQLKNGKGFNARDWATELLFGDYSVGRYGWLLNDPVAFPKEHYISINGHLGLWDLDERICLGCGCTEMNCLACIQKTGQPCYWTEPNLCSACAIEAPNLNVKKDVFLK